MADWYVSSVAWAAIAQFAAGTAYTVGQIIRPLTAPAAGHEYAFRCTTAGTSGTEPSWPAGDNATITSGGATFTNVSGKSTYGWSAAAGTLWAISNAQNNRPVVGDRVFLSSDHSETLTTAATYGFNAFVAAFGLIQVISVNRAGSVPPVAADVQSGAALTANNSSLTPDALCNMYWQGIRFTLAGSSGFNFVFNSSGNKAHYFKNCAIVITNSNATCRITTPGTPVKVWLDNTTFQFGNAGQLITSAGSDLSIIWINTSSAIQGATLPTALIAPASTAFINLTARGVDLSALVGTLIVLQGSAVSRVLLDSCRIASGLTRLSTAAAGGPTNDEVELVNCYDGTNVLNERYTALGTLTTERSTYLNSGAADDIGNYSLKIASSSRSDKFTMPFDSFALDVENTIIGASKTATVEIVSPSSLNDDDISLLLEYLGTSGSAIASFASSLPATVLTVGSALASSVAAWVQGMSNSSWNRADFVNIAFSNANLTAMATTTPSGVRAIGPLGSGKFYWEVTVSVWASLNTGPGVANATTPMPGNAAGANVAAVSSNGTIWINASSGANLGARTNGDVIGIAIDVVNALIWFRVAPSGNWNASGTANPATGTGGVSIAVLGTTLFAWFGAGSTNDACTINSGGGAFSGAVPAGFTSGLPLTLIKQKLQATFTPQVAGRVRGSVRLGKVSTTVWVNPQITIT